MTSAISIDTTNPPVVTPSNLEALSALSAEFERLKATRAPLYEEQERTEAIAKAELAITTEGSLADRVDSIWERTGQRCDRRP